jgi:branched-chain amino acid transport system substrate-binding protein
VAAIGYYDDKFAVQASPVFEECGLLHIVGANNTYMTSHGFRYLIRAVQSSDKIGRALARLCLARGYQTYAIVAEEGAFGEDLAYQTVVELDAQNARVVYQVSYVAGKVDFRAIIDELKAASADVILFLGFEKEAGQFIKSARDLGLDTPIVASSTDTPQLHAIAGETLEGVMFYDDYNVDSPSPENRAFVTRFRRRFGENPRSYAPFGYDALHILAKAIETTGSTDSLSLAYAIRFMDRWEGVTGAYKFDATGEMEGQDLFLKVYRSGVPVLLDTSHPAPQLSPNVR